MMPNLENGRLFSPEPQSSLMTALQPAILAVKTLFSMMTELAICNLEITLWLFILRKLQIRGYV